MARKAASYPLKGTPRVDSLGVVDAQSAAWLQNVPDPRGRQAVALAENNLILLPSEWCLLWSRTLPQTTRRARSLGSGARAASPCLLTLGKQQIRRDEASSTWCREPATLSGR